ncbi:MAG: PQQ-dependent sugar dehydrogenase [Oleiphilaceae bacterium]|nr:PQQ-dependent sugar dehydrogenase [Oleiphilaceae bacterium]
MAKKMALREKNGHKIGTVKTRQAFLKRMLLAGVLFFFGSNSFALPTNFQVETLISNLAQPVYLAELPDGRMLVGTKPGSIRIFNSNDAAPSTTTYLEINNINSERERGLTSIAVDPQFESNGFIYVYYTHGTTQRNRISRFSHLDNFADPASELLIWEDNEDFLDCCHYGGGIGFGPDGKLYLTTGEEFDGPQAQDLSRAGGKIIRINPDGSVPADNPFIDGPGGNLDEIWAYGLRNPYRAHWDDLTGRLFIGEVGGNVEESREDIHMGRSGANYGWPFCEGQCEDPQFDDPIYDYGHDFPGGTGGAVTLGTVYRGSQFPSSYSGVLFFTDYVQGWIRYLELKSDGSVNALYDFAQDLGPIVHMITGADGALYLVDISGSIKRISYISGNQPPTIDSMVYDAFPGPAPALVNFSVSASDPENDLLTYLWLTGDGNEVAGQSIAYEYPQNGVYQARVQITDGNSTVLSEPVEIQVGNPPGVTVDQPLDGAFFRAGEVISFSGTATDPDQLLQESDYSWTIRFGHNTHTHPSVTGQEGSSGTFEVNTSGHDYHGDTRYEFELAVTDEDGLTTTDVVTVYPDKANVQLSTSPINTNVFLDGVPLQTPITYDSLINFSHLVSVAGQVCVDGIQYNFESWSDNGALSHEIVVPETGLQLTANFSEGGTCNQVFSDGLVLHLEADSVVVDSDNSSKWLDLSGQGNDLSGFGDPQLVDNVFNDYPVVAFDGAGDKFERSGTTLNGLPANNENRTVVALTRYASTGYGGFLYGASACDKAFGLGVKPKGELMIEGWCSNFPAAEMGTGAGWLIQSAVLADGALSHYKDGQLIDESRHNFATELSNIVVGANLDSSHYMDMQVAALLVYDRDLTATELDQVHNFLNDKYLANLSQPPVATADEATVESGGSVTVNVLANDLASSGEIDPTSVVLVDQPTEGIASVDPVSGSVTYTHSGGSNSDIFSYQFSDSNGQVSNSADVNISVVSSDGNLAPTALDDFSTVLAGGVVDIPVLDNDTDPEAALDESSLVIIDAPEFGVAEVDLSTGIVNYQHNGLSTEPDTFTYRVSDSSGLSSNLASVSIEVTVPDDVINLDSPLDGDVVQGPSVTLNYTASGSNYDHVDISLDGQPHVSVFDGAGSYTFFDVLPGEHNISLSLVDKDHSPIPSDSAVTSASILVTDDIGSPLAVDDQDDVLQGLTSRVNVLANDVDIDGELDPTSVFITSLPQHGSVLVDATTGAVDYTHDGSDALSDSFSYQVLDNTGLVSNEAIVTMTVGEPIPGSGLVLHIEADRGITANGDTVSAWADQSGLSNDLIAAGDPQLQIGGLNGYPVINFDGIDDKFERNLELNGFPAENQNRTVYFVANYKSAGYGGFGFGTDACNQMFGTSVNKNGELMIQGWCRSTDFHSTITGTGSGWLIQSAVLEGSQLSHYRDGELIDNASNSFNTVLTRLVLGAEIDSNPYLDMDVAAVLVYNRALSPTEQIEVQDYLQDKYFSDAAINQAPTALDDSASISSGDTISIDVLSNDTDPDGSIDPASLVITENSANGSLEIDYNSGAVIYSNYGTEGLDVFKYQVADNLGSLSNVATVEITVTSTTDNNPPIAEDDTGTVVQGSDATIDVLANDSDPEGALDPASVVIVTPPASGNATVDTGTGEILYQHDGVTTETDSFTYAVSDLEGLSSNSASVIMTVTAPEASVIITSPEPAAFLQGSSVTVSFELSGTGYDHLDLSIDELAHESIADPSSGDYTFFNIAPGEHLIKAELADSAHSPLSGQDATDSVFFKLADEIGSPVALDDMGSVAQGSTIRLNVLANDSDIDGTLDATSVFASQAPAAGAIVVDPVTGEIDYTHDGSMTTTDSFNYQVLDNTGLISNEAAVSLAIETMVPGAGLVLRLEGDNGVMTSSDGVTVLGWADQSGLANDLVAAGAPLLLTGALNGYPVIDFDGTADKLERTATLNAFPVGNTDRTVYLVGNYRGTGYGGFGFGNNSCNQMFGTIVNPAGELMIQGWCTPTDFSSGIGGTGAGWLIQSVVLEAGTLAHYRNGILIDTRVNEYNTVLNRLVLGAEIDSKPYVDMQVAALFVYSRALSEEEQEQVLQYLMQKYSIQ